MKNLKLVPEKSELSLVPIPHIMGIMDEAMPLLESAIERSNGRWTKWDVVAALLKGHMHLWVSVYGGEIVSAGVTRFIDYPQRRSLGVMFVGCKKWRDWAQHQETMLEWARGQGCTEMETYVRKGLLRLLPHWTPEWTFMTRKI